MSVIRGIKRWFSRSFDYFGRSRRPEFNKFCAAFLICYIVAYILQVAIWDWSLKGGPTTTILSVIVCLIFALPGIAMIVRRAQDIGLHPIVCFIPLIATDIVFSLFSYFEITVNNSADGLNNILGQILRYFARLLHDYYNYLLFFVLALAPTDAVKRLPFLNRNLHEDVS